MSVEQRLRAHRRDFVNYRTPCPRCGTMLGPLAVTREFLDVPPDPPYGVLVRCRKCGAEAYVEFEPEEAA